jgi:hypothetical protein
VISIFKKLIPIPVTQSGGIRAVAIATHAIHSQSFLNPSDKNAIVPQARAITKSIIVGEILAYISGVNVATGVIFVIIMAIAIDIIMLNTLFLSHLLYI